MANFDDLYATASDLLDNREWNQAQQVLEAARAAARTSGEQALVLHGMAWVHFNPDDKTAFAELLEQAIAQAEARLRSDPEDGRAALALAQAWQDKAMFTLGGNQEEQIALLDTALDRFLETSNRPPRDQYDRLLRRVVARTLGDKATLLRFDNPRVALGLYDELLRRFRDEDDAILRTIAAQAAVWRGDELSILGRTDEEIAAYDDVIARYGTIEDSAMRKVVLEALEQKLLTYRHQEDFEIALEVCDEILERFASETARYFQDSLARALIRKGGLLNKLGKVGPELACYDRVVATWGEDSDWQQRKHAAEALLAKAVALNEADQAAAEMECYEELLRRYAEDTVDSVRAVAVQGLVYMGLSLRAIAEDAAEDTGVLETDAEIACYDRVINRHGDEDHYSTRRAVAAALQHKGESLLDTGLTADAAACFDAIIERYANYVHDTTLCEIVLEARNLRAEC